MIYDITINILHFNVIPDVLTSFRHMKQRAKRSFEKKRKELMRDMSVLVFIALREISVSIHSTARMVRE